MDHYCNFESLAVILCPLSVTDGWKSELANFAPKLKVTYYVGEKEHRRSLRRKMYEQATKESLPDVSCGISLMFFFPFH